MRDSFVFYRSFYEAMQNLSDDEKGKCFEVLANYAINGIEPEQMAPYVRLFFVMAKPQVDKNNQRFENGKRAKKQAETKANLNQSLGKKEANSPQIPAELPANVNENVNVIEKDNLKVIAKENIEIFKKPTLDEVTAYCRERKNTVDPQKWFDYYTANGWKVGKNQMKDWKAAVRTWERADYAAATDTGSWTEADEKRYKQNIAMVEATKRKLAEQVKAKFGI